MGSAARRVAHNKNKLVRPVAQIVRGQHGDNTVFLSNLAQILSSCDNMNVKSVDARIVFRNLPRHCILFNVRMRKALISFSLY